MAAILKVANFDNSDYYDYTDPSNIVKHIAGSFTDETAIDDEPVDVTFKTVAKGTRTQIRTAFKTIERLLQRQVVWKNDETDEESFWLHAGSDGEDPRRSLILEWKRQDTEEGTGDPLLNKSVMVISIWTFSRSHWETDEANLVTHESSSFWKLNTGAAWSGSSPPGTNAGYHNFSGSSFMQKGTMPGRIQRTRIDAPNGPGSEVFEKFWLGIKTTKTALSSSQWKPHESFDSTYGSSTGLTTGINHFQADSNALNSICADIDFSGNTAFKNRLAVPIPTYGNDEEHLRGTYLILYRMRNTAASTVNRTAMFQSWDIISQFAGGELVVGDTFQDVYVESQYWHMYEMGIVQIPPEGYRRARRTAYEELTQLRLGLAAEQVSGSGHLRIDYLAWIPMEHFVSATNIKANASRPINIYCTEEMAYIGQTTKYSPTPWEKFVNQLSVTNWVWPSAPNQTGIMVAAADIAIDDTVSEHHPFASSIEVEFNYLPRYYSFNAD